MEKKTFNFADFNELVDIAVSMGVDDQLACDLALDFLVNECGMMPEELSNPKALADLVGLAEKVCNTTELNKVIRVANEVVRHNF